MPSTLPGYEYDIFISYRQNDNRSGWVTEFVKDLEEELSATIKEPVHIYFDSNPHDGLLETHQVEKSLEGKLRCLIFIPIVSQTYCDLKSYAWQQEFLPFLRLAKESDLGMDIKIANGNVVARVLPVKIHSIDENDTHLLEDALGNRYRGLDFIYQEAGVNRPLKQGDKRENNQKRTDYHNQINKVANTIKDIIDGIILPHPSQKTKIPPERPAIRNKTKIRWIAGIMVAVILGFVLFWSLRSGSADDPIDRSIAVLAFQNMSGDASQEYFSDGIADEIINKLARVKGLKVTGRTSSFYYKEKQETLQEIGRALGVAYLVEGSVQKEGENLRVSAKLVKSDNGFQEWSETYERKLTGLFKVQDDISKSIVENLRLKLEEKSTEKAVSIEAYELYLLAKYHRYNTKNGYDSALQKAFPYLKKAVQMSPRFADGNALLAEVYSLAGFFEINLDDSNNWKEARIFAEKALQLDPINTTALSVLAYCERNDWNWESSKKLYEQAIALDSNNAYNIQQYGLLLCALNDTDHGFNYCQKALKLEPQTYERYLVVLRAATYARKFDEVIKYRRKTSFWFYQMALIQASQHDYKLGASYLLDSIQPSEYSALRSAYDKDGWPGLCEAAHRQGFTNGIFFLGLPQEKLVELAEDLVAKKSPNAVYILTDPIFDPARTNPRFISLVHQMGLDKYLR